MMKLLDATGRPIKAANTSAQAVVLVSEDGESWEPLHGYNVPDWVRDPLVMADMLEGAVVALADAGPYYCAERLN